MFKKENRHYDRFLILEIEIRTTYLLFKIMNFFVRLDYCKTAILLSEEKIHKYDKIPTKTNNYCGRLAGQNPKNKYFFSWTKNLFKINKIGLNLIAQIANIRDQS